MAQSSYLMAGRSSELERLRLQARVWESAAEALFREIDVIEGATAIDLGCGAMGVLGTLSRHVGRRGRVVGIDNDPLQLEAARAYVQDAQLANVEIVEGDAFATGFASGGFDLVHQRFVIAPAGRDAEMLAEMRRLVRPGGVVVLQEPDSASWSLYPASEAFDHLKSAILAAFRKSGGDFDAGRKLVSLLRSSGLIEIGIRADIKALQSGNPYLHLPLQFSKSLEPRLLSGIVTADTLAQWRSDIERTLSREDCLGLTFTLVQAWGRAPN
jgi:ubiquinone/menaquinone biosynthesis C-methylase UbiE